MMDGDLNWREAHRVRLHRYGNDRSSSYPLSYLVPDLGQNGEDQNVEREDAGGLGEEELEVEDELAGKSDLKRDSLEDVSSIEEEGAAYEKPAHTHTTSAGDSLKYNEEETPVNEALDFFFDMKLAGGPIQCSEDDGTCEEMS